MISYHQISLPASLGEIQIGLHFFEHRIWREEDIAYSLVNLLPKQRDGICFNAVFKIIQTLGLDPSYLLDPMIEVHCKVQGGKKVMCGWGVGWKTDNPLV